MVMNQRRFNVFVILCGKLDADFVKEIPNCGGNFLLVLSKRMLHLKKDTKQPPV